MSILKCEGVIMFKSLTQSEDRKQEVPRGEGSLQLKVSMYLSATEISQ